MRRERLSINLANELKKYILETGARKLPSERKLSKMFGVTRTVIREALRLLEYEDVITVIPGKGSLVSNIEKISLEYNIPFKFNVQDKKFIREILDVRAALEEAAVRLAIQNATDKQLEDLCSISEELLKMFENGEEFSETDYLFHEMIFLISGNDLLKYLHKVIRDITDLLWKSPLGNPEFGDRGIPLHRDLAIKMRERNEKDAVETLRKIIEIDREDLTKWRGGQSHGLQKGFRPH